MTVGTLGVSKTKKRMVTAFSDVTNYEDGNRNYFVTVHLFIKNVVVCSCVSCISLFTSRYSLTVQLD